MDEIRARAVHQIDLPMLARQASALLGAGVPLSLLIDLAEPGGPRSHDVYVAEAGDLAWLEPAR